MADYTDPFQLFPSISIRIRSTGFTDKLDSEWATSYGDFDETLRVRHCLFYQIEYCLHYLFSPVRLVKPWLLLTKVGFLFKTRMHLFAQRWYGIRLVMISDD